ncbi:bardet-Biedl syndrome 1 protein [Caerostris extrusa]|uniref:Bardet-Biedl syndrome 1 protein n=1 Tax=Caerostris extrusa TaxID=172846 RepID=A0AAV4SAQ6_CAEEX|nr:bardet-Biedl syndrome 1 protein [Caerostris extrusa]
MDDMLSSYNNKGKCLWSIKLPTSIVTLESVDINIMGMRLVAVTLGNGLIHFYQDKFLVDVLAAEDVVSAVRFGRFGREDNSLVMCMRGGGLCVKILKRTAKFEIQDSAATVRDLQNTKLNLPKKTKLFVDQTMREREHSVIMHRAFQHDLYRLRLTTARSYVNALTSSQNPVSYGAIDPLKLSAQVQGLGPKFILHLELQNTSRNKPSINLFLTFHCDARIYKIQKTYIPISFLAPGLPYTFVTPVECVSEMNISDIIKIVPNILNCDTPSKIFLMSIFLSFLLDSLGGFRLKQGQNIPIITAMINMPVSEGFQPM